MATKFILHIGANKTGSSAVQTFLRQNWRTLLERRILVPDKELGVSDKVTGEHVFAFQDHFERADKAGLEAKLRALSRLDHDLVFFSAENLANRTHFQFFNKALEGLECKVLLYIRRQDEFLTSSWQQWSSKSEVDFNAWLILALQRHGHWQRCIEGWEQVVGAGNVIVRVFQRSDLLNGDVVDDAVATMGLPDPPPPFVRTTELVNPSYSDVITPIVSGSKFLFAGEHDNDFYHMVGKLTGRHYAEQKKVSLLTPEQRDKIIEYYRPQNEQICRKHFPGRPRLFESVDHSKYEYLTKDEMTRRQLEFLTSLVFALSKRLK